MKMKKNELNLLPVSAAFVKRAARAAARHKAITNTLHCFLFYSDIIWHISKSVWLYLTV